MDNLIRWVRGRELARRSSRRKPVALGWVEPLEGRQLLSGLHAVAEHPGRGGPGGHVGVMEAGDDNPFGDRGGSHDEGIVRKAPRFYEFYVGPRRKDLNVVAARARLEPGKGIVFRGIMEGKINTTPATSADDSFYVFGVNRGSPQAVAPFFNRPGVVFDSVVIVSVTHANGITATVRDLRTGVATDLSADLIRVKGSEVRVTVDPALLPTPVGGKPLDQYTFNLWPRSSLANPTPTPAQPHPSFVASFIPENGMAPIQVPNGHGHHQGH